MHLKRPFRFYDHPKVKNGTKMPAQEICLNKFSIADDQFDDLYTLYSGMQVGEYTTYFYADNYFDA